MTIHVGHVLIAALAVLVTTYWQIQHFHRLRLLEHKRQENDLLFMLHELQKFQQLGQWGLVNTIQEDIRHHGKILGYIAAPHPWWWALTKKPAWQRQLEALRQQEGLVFTRYGHLVAEFNQETYGLDDDEEDY